MSSTTPFGEHLKREREMRGVSLEEISAATRISTRFLEAIENDQWDVLPGGVFNRGFIRSIGRFLGLDEDGLIAAYALQNTATSEAVVAAKRTQDVPRNWQPAAIAVVVLILAVAGGLFAYRHYGAQIAAKLHRRSVAVATGSETAGSPADPSRSGDAAATAPLATTVAPASAGDADLTLKVQASKPVDVTILADGKPLYQASMVANESMHFAARDSFDIASSESDALQLELNGQTVAPFGTPGQPGKLSLTRNDLKTAEGDPH